MNLLALDVGQKRIGLAKTDGLGIGVWPIKTLWREELKQDLEKIFNLIEDDAIQKIIIGLPLNQNGSDSTQTQKVRAFANQLKKFLHQKQKIIPVEFWDERLSSWEAEQNFVEAGIKIKKRKELVDAEAACLILRDYLSEKMND